MPYYLLHLLGLSRVCNACDVPVDVNAEERAVSMGDDVGGREDVMNEETMARSIYTVEEQVVYSNRVAQQSLVRQAI